MIVWKSRDRVNTSWNSRTEANTTWNISGRDKWKTKSRDYALGSFFDTVLTAITDPKDGYGIKIKCDPAYLHESNYKSRIEAD